MISDQPTEGSRRFFMGIRLPEKSRALLRQAVPSYRYAPEQLIAEDAWLVPLLQLKEWESVPANLHDCLSPVRQSFFPTITFSHVGRGEIESQVWAWGESSPVLARLLQELCTRMQTLGIISEQLAASDFFIPHVHIATIEKKDHQFLADVVAKTTFPVREVCIFAAETIADAEQVRVIASIPLTA